MKNRQAYNAWSETYDTVRNKTRDLESLALRESIKTSAPLNILEIGCGTGKNTEWLLTKAIRVVGADFSEKMLARAREKISDEKVEFQQFDVREKWDFNAAQFDLVTSSLVLEHIEKIDFVFEQARRVLRQNGLFYIGELHPFKQYLGSKARFDTGSGVFELECFVHHVSDFFEAAKKNNFECIDLKEWFDSDDKGEIPRLLTMMFEAN